MTFEDYLRLIKQDLMISLLEDHEILSEIYRTFELVNTLEYI